MVVIKMIYAVFCGFYSDWYAVGYFNNRVDADKYCTVCGNDEYYVREIKNLENTVDLSKVTLKYEHRVIFDFRDNKWIMGNESSEYVCYNSTELKPNRVFSYGSNFSYRVIFQINMEENNRKKAEKIAQDYLYKLLSYRDGINIYEEDVKLMDGEFLKPFKIKEELRQQEELRQKELAELKRLKEKYEE